ncbi:MAG TPA: Phenylacetic acid catabolic protein [Chloroflexota bacterium]|nr:Phenylacetic acid catabolic protein [Chloroflexota bacterium]
MKPSASPQELQRRLDGGEKIRSVDDMSPEYYQALLNLMLMQADSELAGGIGYMPWIAKAPGINEKYAVANIVREEIGHAHAMYKLLRGIGFDVDSHVARHDWDLRVQADNIGTERLASDKRVNIFYYPIDTWADFIMFNFCMDRGAAHQLYDAEHCSYEPWNRTIKKIAEEEAGHLQHGDLWVQRMAEDAATHDEIQDALDRWFPRVMNIFGRPSTPKNELYRRLGLKVRDNDEVRQAFVDDVTPKLEAWRLRLPDWTPPWEQKGRQLEYVETRDEARYVSG